jgi:tRNA-2-methylthio-N6-dimethylallyladenosine synthase
MRRGTPAARWEQVPQAVAAARFRRLLEAQNEVTRAYHARKVGTTIRVLIAGESKKDPERLSGKTLDNVTVIAPKPPDYQACTYAQTPWLDVAIESARVWGCMGTIVRRGAFFGDAGTPVARPVINLLAS